MADDQLSFPFGDIPSEGMDTGDERTQSLPVESVDAEPRPVVSIGKKLCECGCGSPVRGARARYLPGHNARIMVRTEQHKLRIAEASSRRWSSLKIPGHKRCPKCGQTKPSAEFGIRKNGYLRSSCRECGKGKVRETYERAPGKYRVRGLGRSLYVDHGLRWHEYEEMLDAQGGKCAICGTDSPGRGVLGPRERLSVDHCHETSEIRGLLCNRCNPGVGYFSDDPELMRKAAHYLETARTGKLSVSRRGTLGGKSLKP
jgi:hypothetical protein